MMMTETSTICISSLKTLRDAIVKNINSHRPIFVDVIGKFFQWFLILLVNVFTVDINVENKFQKCQLIINMLLL